MNSLLLSAIVVVWLLIAYRWYGGIIDRKIVRPDDSKDPPSCTEFDGVAGAYFLGSSGKWSVLWPVFASANQLVAALTLIILTAYLIGVKKPSAFTLYPAIFMLATTMGALAWNAVRFFFPSGGEDVNLTLGIACAVLLVLGAMVATEAPRSVRAARERAA